jgi:hypothetical protein
MTVMEELVVWILAAYGCSSLLVALLNKWALRAQWHVAQPQIHYQVLVCNSEHSLENVVWRVLFRSFVQGTPIRISFVDYGSTDDTLKITAVLERNLRMFADDGEPTTLQPITIDLRRSELRESPR